MRITLKQDEIENAVKEYIGRQGIALSGKDVELAFTAGRTERGLSVEISIEPAGTKKAEVAAAPAPVAKVVRDEAAAPAPTEPPAPAPMPAVEGDAGGSASAVKSSLFGNG